jgi:transposase
MVGPEVFDMTAISLRQDYDAHRLRGLARRCKDARQVRRLLALAAVYGGASRTEAAAIGGMDRQTLRDWALRFNAQGPEGLIDRKAPGARPKLTPEQLATVVRLVEDGPIPAIHGVVRWRLVDLAGWIYDEYGVSLDPSRLGRILKGLGYVRLSARPRHHTQNPYALEAFKRDFPPPDAGSPGRATARNPDRGLVPG